MASKKRATGAPAGFRKVETSLLGFWKPTAAGELIQGMVGTAIETRGADGKPNRFYPIHLTTLEASSIISQDDKEVRPTLGGMVGVSGAMLRSFLAAREGTEVVLVYKGKGKAKPGQSAPKLYETYERGESEESDDGGEE